MEVGSGKRQSNHIIVMEDRIKTAKSIVTRILLESVIRPSPKFNRLFPPIPRSLRAPANIGVVSRAREIYEP
jgi:hypothetical protein